MELEENKVTIYTIAEKLGMSVSMVSRAFKPNSKMNNEKRALILETAERMGFVQNKMASRLSMKPIRIAVLIYGRFKGYYDEMVHGIESACRDLSDYKVTCAMHVLPFGQYTDEDAFRLLDQFCEEGYDGIILHGLYDEEVSRRIDAIVESGIPVVTLHNDILSCRRLFTSMNDTELTGSIAAQMLDILLPKKHRKVVLFSGDMKSLVHQTLTFSFIRHVEEAGLQLLRHYATEDCPKQAAAMEPGRMEYQALVSRLQGGGGWYDQMSTPYGGMQVMGNDFCCKLCLANMMCNLCCFGGRGGMFCC